MYLFVCLSVYLLFHLLEAVFEKQPVVDCIFKKVQSNISGSVFCCRTLTFNIKRWSLFPVTLNLESTFQLP